MKSLIILAGAIVALWSISAISETIKHPAVPTAQKTPIFLSGCILNSQCADTSRDNLDTFIKTHPQDCALIPACAASGYSIYLPNGQLLKFTKESNEKIISYLKSPKKNLQVIIEATKTGIEVDLVSIKNKD